MEAKIEIIKFTENLISASDLILRWPGLKIKNLIQLIDERIRSDGRSEINNDFPEPFYLIGTKFLTKKSNKTDKLIYRCQKCTGTDSDRPKDWKPYKTRIRNGKTQHYLKRTVFKESDIEEYEAINKNILYTQEEINQILSNNENTENSKKRLPILQKDAAVLCNVSPSTIRNWDKGRHQPPGYPGRHEGTTFILWAKSHISLKHLIHEAKAMRRAIPMNPALIEKMNKRSAFQDDDEEYEND